MGSVFSPTYFSERKRCAVADPVRFCGINVALYGEQTAWVFTEPATTQVRRSVGEFQVSGSRIHWDRDALVVDVDEKTAVFGRRIRGTIRILPHALFRRPLPIDTGRRHHWWPVAPTARIEVDLEQPDLRFGGPGYHDTNFGVESLESGFSSWWWSRAETPYGTAVMYDTRPTRGAPLETSLLFRPGGTIEMIEAPRRVQLPPTRWGIDRPLRTAERDGLTVLQTLEDTPFYSRTLLQTHLLGHHATAVHESLDLRRFSHPLVQLMVPFRMRRGIRA